MAKGYYREKELQPTIEMLEVVLKENGVYWSRIERYVDDTYSSVTKEWKFYGVAWGWAYVLKSKKKALIYLTPQEGYLVCSFIFNDKGRDLAKNAGFSRELMTIIESGKDNAGGHTFDIPVKNDSDFKLVKQLLDIKFST